MTKAIFGQVSPIQNINDDIISWYCFYLTCIAFELLFGKSILSFIVVLYNLTGLR